MPEVLAKPELEAMHAYWRAANYLSVGQIYDHVVNKKAVAIRVYSPPDANTLLSVTDHRLRSRNYVNVIVAGKQPALQYLDMEAAIKHCTAGIGIWEWASDEEHPHSLSGRDFDALFTTDRPIIFAYHGYPWLIHRLAYRRTNHPNLHVRGYKEEGTTTTPFDMVVRNDLDRFHLVADVIDRVPKLGYLAAHTKQAVRDKLIEHKRYIVKYGDDLPEIRDWKWPAA
jgi:xylulose-5-phosphate/fructose-6-phosphate phosphoketolase